MDILYKLDVSVGTAQDWAGSPSYDDTDYIFDLPLDMIVKSATLLLEIEAALDIPLAYQVTLRQGDNLNTGDDYTQNDLLETGDGSAVRLTWLSDNVIVFADPYMSADTAENWIAETQDTNMFLSKDDFIAIDIHFEDAVGGDTNPVTVGSINMYVILECDVL